MRYGIALELVCVYYVLCMCGALLLHHLAASISDVQALGGVQHTAALKVVVVNRRTDSRSCGIANSRYVTSRTWHKYLYNEVFEDHTLAQYTCTTRLEYG